MTIRHALQVTTAALLILNLSGCFVERRGGYDHRDEDRRDHAYRHCGPHGEDCERDEHPH